MFSPIPVFWRPIPVITVILIFFLSASCKKDPLPITPPIVEPGEIAYTYFNLNDYELSWGSRNLSIDFNGDNYPEIFFSRQLVGDPIEGVDKRQWLVTTNLFTSLPVNNQEQIPVLVRDETIPIQNFSGFTWYNASQIILIERVENEQGHITWRGDWLHGQHKYLPVQVLMQDKRYNGWVELSTDSLGEKIILHRAAISMLSGRDIKCGQ